MKDKTTYSVISGFRNSLIKVWMSADTGRIKTSRFFSGSEEQKQLLHKKL